MANQRFESAIAYINSSANTLFIGDNKNTTTNYGPLVFVTLVG